MEETRKKYETKPFCFVVSPIGDPGSEERNRADGILDEIIRPALEPQYRVERADHDKTPGIVTETIIGNLMEADLVVADLTGNNANVFYELAIRHATGKPVVQVIENGNKLPFDIQAINTVFFTPTLKGRRKAISDLQAAVRAVEQKPDVGNPVKRAGQFRALMSTTDPQIKALTEVVRDLQSSISELQGKLDSPLLNAAIRFAPRSFSQIQPDPQEDPTEFMEKLREFQDVTKGS